MSVEHNFKRSWEYKNVSVIDCYQCGYKHIFPLPGDAELKRLYKEHFGGTVRKGFAQRKKKDVDYWTLAFERRLYTYKHYLDSLCSSATPRILDIGCGTGNFLDYFRKQGWDIQGIEPSQNFAVDLESIGIPNVPKLFNEITDSEWGDLGTFDVINMSMFLEHVLYPQNIVDTVASILKPGGILTIESPNDFNPLQMAIVEAQNLPLWWITSLHINYFNFESLERITKKAGLRPVARSAQFPMELFLHFGEMYLNNPDVGRSAHLKRVKFEKNLHATGEGRLLNQLYCDIAKNGLGRTAIIHSIKEN